MLCPEWVQYYSADTIAECFSYQKYLTKEEGRALYKKLWDILSESVDEGKSTPLGGDGSNGTVETPGEQMSLEYTDKAHHWWGRLNEREQEAITRAYKGDWP